MFRLKPQVHPVFFPLCLVVFPPPRLIVSNSQPYCFLFPELSRWIFSDSPILCYIRRLSLIFLFMWKWWVDNKASCSWFCPWCGLVIETRCSVMRALCFDLAVWRRAPLHSSSILFSRRFYSDWLQSDVLYCTIQVYVKATQCLSRG